MPIQVKSSAEEGSLPLSDKHQTASREQIFGSNNQAQSKWSSLHFKKGH